MSSFHSGSPVDAKLVLVAISSIKLEATVLFFVQLLGAWIATGGWALQFDRDVGGSNSIGVVDLNLESLEKWSVGCSNSIERHTSSSQASRRWKFPIKPI